MTIQLAVEIIAVTVTVPISNSINFACPLKEAELQVSRDFFLPRISAIYDHSFYSHY